MDGWTDWRTDKASYRVACPQLKTWLSRVETDPELGHDALQLGVVLWPHVMHYGYAWCITTALTSYSRVWHIAASGVQLNPAPTDPTHLWIPPQRKSKYPFFLTVSFVFRNMWATKKNKKQKNSSEIFSFISLFRPKKGIFSAFWAWNCIYSFENLKKHRKCVALARIYMFSPLSKSFYGISQRWEHKKVKKWQNIVFFSIFTS